MKEYVIYAGVNGAGKSTLFQTENQTAIPRINLDEIVRRFGDWRNPSDVYKAGKIATKMIKEYLDTGISFNQETTLCGNSMLKNIKKAKDLGYIIKIYYVGVSSVEIAKDRVRKRVADGGHGIPEKDIERRYEESFDKLIQIIPVCDQIKIYDNTENFRKVAIFNNGKCIKVADKCPEWCLKIMERIGK